ncbi:MAG TPA: nitroreductase family protein [Polyangiaceae bacterium]|jgi:nitroreductase
METLEQIHNHRSIRTFTPESVPEPILDQILGAAVRAPTGGNMQLYSIIVTTEPARRDQLAALHFGSESVRQAPVVMTFCVDTHRISRWLELEGEQPGMNNMWAFAIGFSDALLAAQNAVLAAESLGLGTCFAGSTFAACPALVQFFECPPRVVPVATLTLGYPAELSERTPRLPVDTVAHRERYRAWSDQELVASYAAPAQETYQKFCQVPSVGAAATAFGITGLAAMYARLNYPPDLIETAGGWFMSTVERQGFCTDSALVRIAALRRAGDSPEIAALPVMRQIVLSLAIVSGHVDALLGLPPEECELKISSFLLHRDAQIYQDFETMSLFHPGLRARLYSDLEELARAVRRAA